MTVAVGISGYSGLGAQTVQYLDSVVDRFDSVWLPDHLQSNAEGVMEGWTLLSYCLARYPDKIAGHQVLCNEFRHPAVLAKMVATAQVVSEGRVVLGIGAGWHSAEALAFGIPFPGIKTRVDRLIEAVAIMRAMWTGAPVSFSGDFYELDQAECLPAPQPIPPVMIGASGDRHGLRAVAASADWWNYIFQSPEQYATKRRVLAEHCERIGRDPATIKQVLGTQVLIAETEAEVKRMQHRSDVRRVEKNGIAGTPDQVFDMLASGISGGAEMVIVGFADSPRTAGAELFAETVLSRLRRL
jgi:alkanesulfonate monooxygenase SsuD/methylene tetrahydromethanopterin reductase-like flavin-dependent oxidoreductase (luciferase family)